MEKEANERDGEVLRETGEAAAAAAVLLTGITSKSASTHYTVLSFDF